MYVRTLIEYGSSSFLAMPKSNMEKLQKIQNEAIRICLHLPRYIRIDLLHEYAGIDTIAERLKMLNQRLLATMVLTNEDIKKLANQQHLTQTLAPKSPLDLLRSLD